MYSTLISKSDRYEKIKLATALEWRAMEITFSSNMKWTEYTLLD